MVKRVCERCWKSDLLDDPKRACGILHCPYDSRPWWKQVLNMKEENMPANKKKIDRIIKAIREEEIAEFDMTYLIRKTDCGTVACILGFYNLLERSWWQRLQDKRKNRKPEIYYGVDDEKTRRDFGMSLIELRELFYSTKSNYSLFAITPRMAIAALEDVKEGKFTNWTDYSYRKAA